MEVVKTIRETSESFGNFKLRYGYNSSMTLPNVLTILHARGIPAQDVVVKIGEMAKVGVPQEKLPNYLADYYKLFGW